MEKYGFFGGSFNPVTKAHVELAREIVDAFNLDKVIFVPMGDNYNKKELVSESHRYNMLAIATKEYDKLEVSDIELNQEKSLTTLEAFKKIEEAYPDIEKYYIMGADNLVKMIQSEDIETLAKDYKYIVIQRNNINCKELMNQNEILNKNKENFIIMNNQRHSSTSATTVRKDLQSSKIVQLLDKNVLDYIEINELYR